MPPPDLRLLPRGSYLSGDVVRYAALVLRVGLGLVIFSGGWAKLRRLLDPSERAAILEQYMAADGYINTFFAEQMFTGPLAGLLTPWSFLTTLSAFELVCGLLFMAGVLVRPLAVVWGLMFWSFLAGLPVSTAAGIEVTVPTHETPALLVLARDIGLSGLFFVLFGLGAGAYSVDERIWGAGVTRREVNWDRLGLLLRLSLAFPLVVGASFAGADHIQTFAVPWWLLALLALPLVLNVGARYAGATVALLMLWFMAVTFDGGRDLIANMNAFKREFAFLAAALLLAYLGGGRLLSVLNVRSGWRRLLVPGDRPSSRPETTRV